MSEPAIELYRDVFAPLEQGAQQNRHSPLYLRFVDTAATHRNVVVYSAVTPLQFPRSLIHLLLSKGHFQTELDLYSCTNLREAFVQTGLLQSVTPSEEEVATLIRSYVTEQLQWLPMGNKQFQNIVRMLPVAFQSFLFDDTYVFDSMPLATDIAISAAASDALQHLEMEWQQCAVAAFLQYHFPYFPDVDALREGVITLYDLLLHHAPAQTDASFEEQQPALRDLRTAIDSLNQPGQTFVRFPLLVAVTGYTRLGSRESCIDCLMDSIVTSSSLENIIRHFYCCHQVGFFCYFCLTEDTEIKIGCFHNTSKGCSGFILGAGSLCTL